MKAQTLVILSEWEKLKYTVRYKINIKKQIYKDCENRIIEMIEVRMSTI